MREKEQRLWDRFRTNMNGRNILLERLENSVGSGRPDVDALCLGRFTPVELKAVDMAPARATTPLLGKAAGLSVAQRNWHLTWCQHGGRSLILVGVGSKINLAVEGQWADLINVWTLQQIASHACAATWSELAWALGWRPR